MLCEDSSLDLLSSTSFLSSPTPPHQPQDLCTGHSLCQECSSPQISTVTPVRPVVQSCLTLCGLMNCSTPGSPSFTISRSLLKFMSNESSMPSNHLILCHPLLLLPSIFPSIRVSSNESALHIRWPKNTSYKPLLKCHLIRKTSPDHHLMKSHLHLSLHHPFSLPCAVSLHTADHYLLVSIFTYLVVFLFIVSFCKSAPSLSSVGPGTLSVIFTAVSPVPGIVSGKWWENKYFVSG